ncbi:sensor histidine kinase [Segetibacter sp. 3557_3]|uniref:sensor histidine kinase n=1 Tax=Segetibacter sp. 3557_3 TaxID=2547429 RepID=UPI0010588BD5|nr:sensor histidine kinase [Segetibacter sp. 3557_3]TDH21286.1 sensor histidine kinase [Segetibacter sp. 3557_3]
MHPFEREIYIAILIAAIVLAIILFFFLYTLVKHQRINSKQYKLQIQAEIIAREEERRRIAVDLHDDLGPFLSSMKLQINLLNTEDPDDKNLIRELSLQINEIVQKIRETSNNLLPNVLVRKGLVRALTEFSQTITKTGNIKVNAEFVPEHFELEKDVEIHLYRICQEALHNTIRHAKANNFYLKLEREPAQLNVSISDDGIGFNYAKMKKDSMGLGLKNMLSRVDFLNGEFYLDTHPGRGVVYTIQIPLKANL